MVQPFTALGVSKKVAAPPAGVDRQYMLDTVYVSETESREHMVDGTYVAEGG